MQTGGRPIDARAIESFGKKLTAWAQSLDPTSGAMLVDLLSKAGGDVDGVDDEPDTDRHGADPTSDVLAPLQLGDFLSAVRGVIQNAPSRSMGGT